MEHLKDVFYTLFEEAEISGASLTAGLDEDLISKFKDVILTYGEEAVGVFEELCYEYPCEDWILGEFILTLGSMDDENTESVRIATVTSFLTSKSLVVRRSSLWALETARGEDLEHALCLIKDLYVEEKSKWLRNEMELFLRRYQ
jgi:hypothetical protein